MVFKRKKEEELDEFDDEPEMETEEEMEDLDSEEGDVKSVGGRKKKGESYDEKRARGLKPKTPAVYQRPEPVVRGGKNWLINQIPQSFECIDPINGEVVLRAGSYEELMLSLQVMATQHAVESAKNTR